MGKQESNGWKIRYVGERMIKLEQGERSWWFNPESFLYAQVDRDKSGYVVNLLLKFSYYDYYTTLEFEGKDAELNFVRIENFLEKNS
jgi:hypothetical protein